MLPADEGQGNEAIDKVVSFDSPSKDMSSLSSTQPDPSNVTVKVLKATRIPSCHCRMVRAYIDSESKLLAYSKSGRNSGQEAVGHHKLLFDPEVKQEPQVEW